MTDLAVQFEKVGKVYPFFSLEEIDLEVPIGTIAGLVGANGAGKSTTLRLLAGLIRPEQGRIRVLGNDLEKEAAEVKRDIGFVSEDFALYRGLTLTWHIEFVRSIFGTWDTAYGERLLERFDLEPSRRIRDLSRGQHVLASLFLALARRPRLLVLDEPTAGLDPIARHEVLRALGEVLAEEDRTVLFSSQNTLDIEQICDQVTFIDRGRLLGSMEKEDLLESWRSIRLRVPPGVTVPKVAGVVRDGGTDRLRLLRVSPFEPSVIEQLQATGASVEAVDRMTLEEIFVAAVMREREGGRE